MKTITLFAFVLVLGVSGCAQQGEVVEPVKKVNLGPHKGGSNEGAIQGLWMERCREILGWNDEVVGVTREALLLRRNGTFEVHTTYYTERDCSHPELAMVSKGTYRMGGLAHNGRAIAFNVASSGYVPFSDEGMLFLGQECTSGAAPELGRYLPEQDCKGGEPRLFTFHSAYRRVNASGALPEGMLIAGGLELRPNSTGDTSLKYPPADRALLHVSAQEDVTPATYAGGR